MSAEFPEMTADDVIEFIQLLHRHRIEVIIDGGWGVDAQGRFGYPYLDLYWTEQGRHPFLLRMDGKLAGFALVNKHTILPTSEWSIAEFFIMRKYRRRGLGKQVAHFIFDQFRGRWEVSQIAADPGVRQFWKKVIGEYTGGRFEEVVFDDEREKGTVQVFENGLSLR